MTTLEADVGIVHGLGDNRPICDRFLSSPEISTGNTLPCSPAVRPGSEIPKSTITVPGLPDESLVTSDGSVLSTSSAPAALSN